jgi:(1->4)-alpha-D-glucan 1-alpha-D-glucosylmutase
MVRENKRPVADGIQHSEVLRITREVEKVLETRDEEADEASVADAIGELVACFPVYRSYLPEGRDHLDQAFAAARASRPDLAATYDVLEPVMHDEWGQPARRFQQTSGMVMAKGVEDCSFYRWSRLTSLNEVGGDPSIFAIGVDTFHDAMAARQRDWPDAMVTLSTHDTKRGEDVRARIAVIAERPERWGEVLAAVAEAGWSNALAAKLVAITMPGVPDVYQGSELWEQSLVDPCGEAEQHPAHLG